MVLNGIDGDVVSRPVRIGRRHAQVFGETIYISRFGILETMYLYLYLYELRIGRKHAQVFRGDHTFVFVLV